MKFKKSISLFIGIVIVIAVCITQYFGGFNNFENTIEDYLYQTGSKVNSNIYVIGIDEETLNRYGAFDVWSRDKIGDIINVLMEDPSTAPKVIAVDISLFGEKDKEIDDKLVEAVRNAGNVIFTSSVTNTDDIDGQRVILMEEPFDDLKEACLAYGFSNLIFDTDGVVRHCANKVEFEGVNYDSFDVKIAEAYSGKDINDVDNNFYIMYSAKSHAYYGITGAGCSFYKVLEGEYPLDTFTDKIVIIGAYASGTQDNYYTSIDKDNQMYGAEIHANIVNQILEGTYKHELAQKQAILLTVAFGALSLLIISFIQARYAVILDTFVSIMYIIESKFLYGFGGVILPIFYVCVTVLLITVVHITASFIEGEIEKKKLVKNISRYMPPELAKQVAANSDNALTLGGEKKNIAVLFVDIRGFTTLSESLTPEDLVLVLNKYFDVTTKSIIDNKGIIDKFIGDCTMGLFNALTDDPDYIYHAVCAGLQMTSMSKELNENLPDPYKGKIQFGVGVHYGPAVVGNIGTSFRMDYTAIGDTVNTASRIEGQTHANQVLISEDVYQVVKDRFIFEDSGFVKLKGKKDDVHIYTVVSKK